MTIPIRVKNKKISTNKNYNFFSKLDSTLKSKKRFFAHVTGSDLIAVQVKNTSAKPYVIPKNFKLDHLRDFEEKECFLTTPKNRHLAIIIANKISIR